MDTGRNGDAKIPVDDEFVPEETYRAFIERMPQICVELVLETSAGVLLAKRTNRPRVWFWPGGRLYKGERLADAARRVAREELGIEVSLIGQLGPYAHFWAATADGPSRHTVNVPYRGTQVDDDAEITLDDQHTDYRFVDGVENWMHEYVKQYLRDLGLD